MKTLVDTGSEVRGFGSTLNGVERAKQKHSSEMGEIRGKFGDDFF